jgi:hypothetical protein
MNYFNKKICILVAFALFSCADNDEYSISTPAIESAAIAPTTFTFGDSVMLTAKLTDADARLATLTISIIVGDRTIDVQNVPIGGNSEDLSIPVFVPLVDNLPDGADVKIALNVKNVLKGAATHEITGLKGNRPYYNRLYLVTDDGEVFPLTPQSASKDRYETTGLTLYRSFNYKIAQKITGNQIDYSGLVWGNKNGKISLIGEQGESAFAYASGVDYVQTFVYDNNTFGVTLSGKNFAQDDLVPARFEEETIDGELFRKLTRTLAKNQELTLFNEFAAEIVVCNPDFFERTTPNKIKFLGETGTYTLYFNTYRKQLLIGVENPAYPDYLLITGGGIGYPTKVPDIDKAHAWWGFGNVRNFILCRKIAVDVYQATIYILNDPSWVGLKPYENTGWGGEKTFDKMTFTGEQIFESPDGGDWKPKTTLDPNVFYRLTINWATNTVNVEKVTL